jgi:hypothetical protein
MPAFIFQANPIYYDILARFRSAAFAAAPQLAWPAPERQGRVEAGDWAFVYVGGSKGPGIYAAGRVTELLPPASPPPTVRPWAGAGRTERARTSGRAGEKLLALRRAQGERFPTSARPARFMHPRAAIAVVRYAPDAPLVERAELRVNGLPVGVHWRTVVPISEEQASWLLNRLGLHSESEG